MGTNDAPSNSTARSLAPAADRAGETLALPSWQAELRSAVRDPAELLRLLDLTPAALGPPHSGRLPAARPARLRRAHAQGRPARSRCCARCGRSRPSAPADGFSADPVREQGSAAQGVIQKYPGRVLLIASGACPLHCRYCFRREFPVSKSQLAARADWSSRAAARHVPGDGSDPGRRRSAVALEPAPGRALHARRHGHDDAADPHVPIAIPERVDAGLLRLCAARDCCRRPHEPCERARCGVDSGAALTAAVMRLLTSLLVRRTTMPRTPGRVETAVRLRVSCWICSTASLRHLRRRRDRRNAVAACAAVCR